MAIRIPKCGIIFNITLLYSMAMDIKLLTIAKYQFGVTISLEKYSDN